VSDPSGAAGDARSRLRHWQLSVCAVFALAGMGASSWLSRVADVRSELQLTVFAMGVLSLGLSIGSVAGFTVAGRVARRLPPRAAMLLSLVVAGSGSVLAGLSVAAHSAPGIMLGLAVLGFGTGVCNVTMNVDAVAIERGLRRPVMPWFHAMFSIGGVIGAGIGAAATALRVPVPAQLVVVALGYIAASVWAVRGVPARDAALRAQEQTVTRVAEQAPEKLTDAAASPAAAAVPPRAAGGWRDRRTLLIGLLVLGMSFANGAANDWISLAMVSGHGASAALGATTFWVFVMATTVTRLVGTAALARWGRQRVLRFSAACAAVGIGCFVVAPDAPLAVVGAMLWGFGSALGFPIGMSAAGDEPETAARNIGVVATIGYAASLAGPPLLGLAGDRFGLLHALIAPLVTVVIAGALAGVVRPRASAPRASARGAGQATASS
jgi:MFS family permease